MKRCRFIISVLVGTFVYVLVSLMAGRDGIWATRQMEEQRRILSTRSAAIEKTNEQLKMEKSALLYDMDVIAAYARKLGFVKDGEKLVKVSGLAQRETRIFDPGIVQKSEAVSYLPEWFCKSSGLVIFILMYIILFLYDFNHGYINFHPNKKYYNMVKGTPIYEIHEI